MWKIGRHRQNRAADAIALVVQDAILLIRTMAYRRQGLSNSPFVDAEDYQEEIRRLADLCDTLIPGLRRLKNYSATNALQYTWETRADDQRRFLQEALAHHGIAISDFIIDRRGTTA